MVITFKNTPIINTPLTLCQKSCRKPIKKRFKTTFIFTQCKSSCYTK